MPRIIAGTFLALHGIAHAVGFTASWRVVASPDSPYTTAILNGSIDVGDEGARLLGIFWLIAALAMGAAGVQVARGAPHALRSVVAATAFSLVLCLAGLPASAIGLAVDVAILAVLVVVGGLTVQRRRTTSGAT